MSTFVQLAHHAFDALPMAEMPKPTDSTPPGASAVNKLLGWLKWFAYAACLAGVIIAGAGMAIAHRSGNKQETVVNLGWVIAACIIIGSSTAIVAEFLV